MEDPARDLQAHEQAEEGEAGHARAARQRGDGEDHEAHGQRDGHRLGHHRGPDPGQVPLPEELGGQGQGHCVQEKGRGQGHGQVEDQQHAELARDVVPARERSREVDQDGARAQVVGHEAGAAEDRDEHREGGLPGQELAEETAVHGQDAVGLGEAGPDVDADDLDHEGHPGRHHQGQEPPPHQDEPQPLAGDGPEAQTAQRLASLVAAVGLVVDWHQ